MKKKIVLLIIVSALAVPIVAAIKVDHTPAKAVGELARRAGRNQAIQAGQRIHPSGGYWMPAYYHPSGRYIPGHYCCCPYCSGHPELLYTQPSAYQTKTLQRRQHKHEKEMLELQFEAERSAELREIRREKARLAAEKKAMKHQKYADMREARMAELRNKQIQRATRQLKEYEKQLEMREKLWEKRRQEGKPVRK